MNRTTSLFLALGILVAHSLAIHHTEFGRLAPAFDEAHVAFRVARQLVRNGVAFWNLDDPSFDSYPSLLWIAVCWIPERLYWDPATFSQTVGVLCALATSVVVSRFSRDRLAGIIAPMLLVMSGAFASAAISGLETPLLALLATSAFLAFERRRARLLAVLTALLVATRPEGMVFVLGLAALELVRGRGLDASGAGTRNLLPWLAPAAVVAALVGLARLRVEGLWLSPATAAILEVDGDRARLGASYLLDFVLKSGSASLVVFPVAALARGKLTGMGARALGLALLWCALVLWTGGSSLPMWNALVPALPILFLSIQEGMTAAMDSQRPGLSAITWSAFGVALVASALVSKTPGNVGSIPLASTHFAAMQPSPRAWAAWETPLGRVGLRQEIRDTERLRAIGKFLREELDAEHDVATPWPGAIGYMSRRRVRDLLGRTSSAPGDERRAPWFGSPPRVDLVACLEERPDHVILSLTPFGEAIRDTLHLWLRRWDRVGETPARVQELLAALKDYELVTVPIEDRAGTSMFTTNAAFFLLRREDIGLDVELDVEVSPSGEFRVLARHDGYEQLANLEIEVVDSGAARWSMRPNGEFTRQPGVSARARVLLHRTGARSIELAAGRIPPSLDARQLRATLRNPGIAERYAFSKIGNEVRVDLR